MSNLEQSAADKIVAAHRKAKREKCKAYLLHLADYAQREALLEAIKALHYSGYVPKKGELKCLTAFANTSVTQDSLCNAIKILLEDVPEWVK